MDDSSADIPPRSQLLAELTDELGMPIIAVVNGWCGNNIHNLGEEGARAFIDVFDAELDARDDVPESVGLFLVGRGGFAIFADGVWRALNGRGVGVNAIIPHRIDGALSLLALSTQRRLMHPYGAVGAYDRRPLGCLAADLDTQTRLSRQMMRRMLGGTESGLGARVERQLCADALGADLALSPAELDKLGLETRTVDGRTSELVWQLYLAYERELEVLEVAMPRFTQSQVADEVEFEPATGLTGAVIEGLHDQIIFELDTGSPNPDTGMLEGEWLWDRGELSLVEV